MNFDSALVLDANLLEVAAHVKKVAEKKSIRISVAESCTGGLVSFLLTTFSGSSGFFDRGFVTYSDQSKIDVLGVKSKTMERFGAVSEFTAVEMARGAAFISRSILVASVTGFAEPGSEGGKTYISSYYNGIEKNDYLSETSFNRSENRNRASLAVLKLLILRCTYG